ncbi:MAG: hypothetical protein LBJ76_05325 [Candidatus Accumulibacter sp.]|jgi:prophage antirepressor-like protein|nr:hypothetical protein [Accumulibacter sp.]
MSQSIIPFSFENYSVRTTTIDGEPWFVAQDVLSALEYAESYTPKRAIEHVPAEWKGLHPMKTPGGTQSLLMISEQGLYFFLGRSDKPKALPFQKWLAGEVLPAIRKTGGYIHAPAMQPALTSEQQRELTRGIREACGWWMIDDADKWIYNHLRVAFRVARWQDIPEECYSAARALVESKTQESRQFGDFIRETCAWFCREAMGGGMPWTPAFQRKLSQKLKRRVILPPKVDWLTLAEKQSDASKDA